jgi:hypothetical protein
MVMLATATPLPRGGRENGDLWDGVRGSMSDLASGKSQRSRFKAAGKLFLVRNPWFSSMLDPAA